MLTEREEMIVAYLRERVERLDIGEMGDWGMAMQSADRQVSEWLDEVEQGEAFKKPPASIPYETWRDEPSVGHGGLWDGVGHFGGKP